MNHHCHGDCFTITSGISAGQYYRCFADGEIVRMHTSWPAVCPRCEREVIGTETVVELRTVTQVRANGRGFQWSWTELPADQPLQSRPSLLPTDQ